MAQLSWHTYSTTLFSGVTSTYGGHKIIMNPKTKLKMRNDKKITIEHEGKEIEIEITQEIIDKAIKLADYYDLEHELEYYRGYYVSDEDPDDNKPTLEDDFEIKEILDYMKQEGYNLVGPESVNDPDVFSIVDFRIIPSSLAWGFAEQLKWQEVEKIYDKYDLPELIKINQDHLVINK